MTALMYKKPEDHIQFLEVCLEKAKADPKIRWHSFIEPLPPIPRSNEKIQTEAEIDRVDSPEASQFIPENQNKANTLAEKVFQEHINDINALDENQHEGVHIDQNQKDTSYNERPWYADYTEKQVDTSGIQGKPIVFVLGKNNYYLFIFTFYTT